MQPRRPFGLRGDFISERNFGEVGHFTTEKNLRLPGQGERFAGALHAAGGAGEDEQENGNNGNRFSWEMLP